MLRPILNLRYHSTVQVTDKESVNIIRIYRFAQDKTPVSTLKSSNDCTY